MAGKRQERKKITTDSYIYTWSIDHLPMYLFICNQGDGGAILSTTDTEGMDSSGFIQRNASLVL